MFKMSEEGHSIRFTFSSEMHLADRVVQASREYLSQFEVEKFSQFRLVLRELLINAVEHGNREIVDRMVTCTIKHLGEWQFKITVEDEGDGFDYKSLDMKLPNDPDQLRKRGYPMINAFTDRLEFNDKGNRIVAYISIPHQTRFSIEQDNNTQVIRPSGDITASIADKLRAILVDLLDRGYRQYRFDFTNVEDIDSVALSVMIVFSKMLGSKGEMCQLEIVNAGKSLADLFHMTRMDRIYIIKN